MEVFEFGKKFPSEERFSLTDQVRRSSRAVSGIIAEAWRKRRYPKSFVAKLNDAEAKVAETQVWLDYALAFNYINLAEYKPLYEKYEHLIAMLITIYTNSDQWKLLKSLYISYHRAIVPSLYRAYF